MRVIVASAKEILVGGLAFFAASLVVGLVLALPDEALFEEAYRSMGPSWREGMTGWGGGERQFFLVWLAHKLVFGLGVGILYGLARSSLSGPGWKRGAYLGLGTLPLVAATYLGLWSVLALPGTICVWWSAYYLINALASGAAMGAAVDRFAGSSAKSPASSLLHPTQGPAPRG